MRIAVIGAGPAGSRAASRLARAGHDVRLIDRTFDREKPCGGGVPWAGLGALAHLPRGAASSPAARPPGDCQVGAFEEPASDLRTGPPAGGLAIRRVLFEVTGSPLRAEVALPRPVVVFSRRTLDRTLVEDARTCGARLVQDAVVSIERVETANVRRDAPGHGSARHGATAPSQDRLSGGQWSLALASGERVLADHIVGADGARSMVRRLLGTPFSRADLSQAVGWYIPGVRSDTMTIRFDARIRGYLWIFPRADHLAVGACAPLAPGIVETLWSGARGMLVRLGRSEEGLPRYSALIPSLGPAALRANQVAGPGWSLVGDAAGTVDPLTREGIRHALRSADLLAEAFESGDPETYGALWREAFLPEFSWAAARSERFFDPGLTTRLVSYLSRSRSIRRVMVDLILGAQDYPSLKRRLVRAALPAGVELGWAKARRWMKKAGAQR